MATRQGKQMEKTKALATKNSNTTHAVKMCERDKVQILSSRQPGWIIFLELR